MKKNTPFYPFLKKYPRNLKKLIAALTSLGSLLNKNSLKKGRVSLKVVLFFRALRSVPVVCLSIGCTFFCGLDEGQALEKKPIRNSPQKNVSLPAEAATTNVKIIADTIECNQKKQICIALGNAFIEKLNDPDKKTIQADRIEMWFEKVPSSQTSAEKPTGEVGGQKPKEFHARGNVVVVLKDTIIRGDKAIYNPDTEIAEVFENVSVTSGQNEVVGDYGHADLKTSEYKVRNSKGRVTALVFQGADQPTQVKK